MPASDRVVADAPSDAPLRGVSVGTPYRYENSSGDNWIAALAPDGTLYVPSNDSGGFNLAERVADVLGLDPEEAAGLNVYDPVYDPDGRTKAYLDRAAELGVEGSTVVFNVAEGADPYALEGRTITTMPDFYELDQVTIEDAQYFKRTGELPSAQRNDRCTWKSSGCAVIDDVLYWVVTRNGYGEMSGDPHARETQQNATIIASTDGGRSWSPSAREALDAPMFAGTAFAAPYFVDYGPSSVRPHGGEAYVYAVSNNGFWDNGDQLILGRVRRDRMPRLEAGDWEFLAGEDGLDDAAWVAEAASARPILARCGRLGRAGMSYLPLRGRYVTIGWHYPAGSGKANWPESEGVTDVTVWEFFESPTPWGPWTQIGAHAFFPEAYYVPNVLPCFQSSDRVYVMTGGDFRKPAEYYKMTIVPVDLV
jgi:hypothetical protein